MEEKTSTIQEILNGKVSLIVESTPLTTSSPTPMSLTAANLDQQERELANFLIAITQKYGKFNEDATGVWAGYKSAAENNKKDIGVKCSNCTLWEGGTSCKIIAMPVEPEGKCRFAVIPDGVVKMN
jgi:hypothetical protein